MKQSSIMFAAMALLVGFFTFGTSTVHAATETYNGITCVDYANNGNYPSDGNHFKTCFQHVPTDATIIRNKMYGANVPVRNLLQAQDVSVYFFANRTAANLFFSGHPDYGTSYESNTARCGNTYRKPNGRIAVAIYKSCTFQSGQVVNPDLQKVTAHEKGHAFALALAKSQGNLAGPDRSTGYQLAGNYDRNQLGNIAAICTIFGQHLPSALELDLGASPGQVCSTTNQILAPYIGLTAKQIHDLRAPYFVNPPVNDQYAELWAEQYSIEDGGTGGTSQVLQMTDVTIGDNRLRCTMWIMHSFWTTLKPVGPNNPHPSFKNFPVQYGCPNITEQQQW